MSKQREQYHKPVKHKSWHLVTRMQFILNKSIDKIQHLDMEPD